ncbi:MAG: glycosyltransferase family 4 protein [Thermoflexaceae bacterium]|nr:glycosyltransferase family 4 protein [Thermoflexaceae bacterium]
MKKVVIITNIPSPYRVDFFYYLQENVKKYEFHVIYSSVRNTSRQWHADENRIQNSCFLKSYNIKIKKRYDEHDIYIPYGVGKVLSNLKPDVVVAMEYNPTILMAMHWCRKHKVKYISWTDGTLNSEKNISKIQRLCRKYIISRADAFIGSSTASRETQIAYGASPEKCHISYLTVDLEKYIRKKESYGNRQLVCVGGLIVRKGVDLLLNALALTDSSITLVVVGDGGERERLIKQAESLGIADRVTFRGFLEGEELYQCYAQSDAFVLPTREDCFGLVTLEAMCAQLPVISSQYADGARDLIEKDVTGIIVDPYDEKAFAKAIEELVMDTDRLEKMGKAGFERINRFSFENVSKGYVEAIDSVITE